MIGAMPMATANAAIAQWPVRERCNGAYQGPEVGGKLQAGAADGHAVRVIGLAAEGCEVADGGGERLDRCASVRSGCEQRRAGCSVANRVDAGERVDVGVVADASVGWSEGDGRRYFSARTVSTG